MNPGRCATNTKTSAEQILRVRSPHTRWQRCRSMPGLQRRVRVSVLFSSWRASVRKTFARHIFPSGEVADKQCSATPNPPMWERYPPSSPFIKNSKDRKARSTRFLTRRFGWERRRAVEAAARVMRVTRCCLCPDVAARPCGPLDFQREGGVSSQVS